MTLEAAKDMLLKRVDLEDSLIVIVGANIRLFSKAGNSFILVFQR